MLIKTHNKLERDENVDKMMYLSGERLQASNLIKNVRDLLHPKKQEGNKGGGLLKNPGNAQGEKKRCRKFAKGRMIFLFSLKESTKKAIRLIHSVK